MAASEAGDVPAPACEFAATWPRPEHVPLQRGKSAASSSDSCEDIGPSRLASLPNKSDGKVLSAGERLLASVAHEVEKRALAAGYGPPEGRAPWADSFFDWELEPSILRLHIPDGSGAERRTEISIEGLATIGDLKARAFAQEISSGCQLKLICGGRLLADTDLIRNLPNGSVVQCFVQKPPAQSTPRNGAVAQQVFCQATSMQQDVTFHAIVSTALAVAWGVYMTDALPLDSFSWFSLCFFSMCWAIVCCTDFTRKSSGADVGGIDSTGTGGKEAATSSRGENTPAFAAPVPVAPDTASMADGAEVRGRNLRPGVVAACSSGPTTTSASSADANLSVH